MHWGNASHILSADEFVISQISLMIQKTPGFLEESRKMCKFLDFLLEKMMKQKETNEVMAIKFHYLRHILEAATKSAAENQGSLGPWIKR